MSLQAAIQQLDNCLSTYCRPMYNRLQPPLSNTEAEAYFNKWGISDADLTALFMWKNGIENDPLLQNNLSHDYSGYGVIPTLQYIDKILELEVREPSWSKTLFPLITSFAGDFILYQTSQQSSQHGMLFLHCPARGYAEGNLISYYDNIERMIATITECFETSAFFYAEDEMSLEEDFQAASLIRKKHNLRAGEWFIE